MDCLQKNLNENRLQIEEMTSSKKSIFNRIADFFKSFSVDNEQSYKNKENTMTKEDVKALYERTKKDVIQYKKGGFKF